MKTILITGSSGLIGSEAVQFFSEKDYPVVGIDNDMRSVYFGDEASTEWNRRVLSEKYPEFRHHDIDIRDQEAVGNIFKKYNEDISLIIHCAAQPSHDWAAKDPFTDFTVNANGTLNLLENTRAFCPAAVFIFCSTNKVYGDTPNYLPLFELDTRWEIEDGHIYYNGIDENMSIDQSTHSLFGASKIAADVMVQEYGKYFCMKTACFRGGCMTGPKHSGTMLHGFLSYLMKCCMTGEQYNVMGYKGKQVRDNIHSYDLVNAFYHFYRNPREGEVYNIGGSRFSNCSMLEGISICEEVCGKKLKWTYSEKNRVGDHIWYISSVDKLKAHYPEWELQYNMKDIILQIHEAGRKKW